MGAKSSCSIQNLQQELTDRQKRQKAIFASCLLQGTLMKNPLPYVLLFLSSCTTPLAVLHQEKQEMPLVIRELQEEVADLKHSLHNAQVEISLLEEQLHDSTKKPLAPDFSPRLAKIEKQIEKILSYKGEQDSKIQELQDTLYSHKKILQEVSSLKNSLSTLTSSFHKETVSYRVKPGDSLEKIAKMFKISVSSLKETNQLSQNTIRIGQELIIPDSSP